MENFLIKFVISYIVLNLKKGSSIRVDVHKETIRPLIIGGSDANLGEFPYQALLYTTRIENGRPNRYLCGGSLLNSQFVLTAGHCITGASKIEVVLGITDRLSYGETGVSQMAKKWILHENYQPFSHFSTLANDIALVLLSKKIEENEYIKYIEMETDPKHRYSKGTISGWGKTYDSQTSGTTHLQHGEVKIISNSRCVRAYPKLKSTTFCVVSLDEHKVEAPCNGDSGGPLVILDKSGKEKLFGIVSYGKRNACEKGHPAVFTRVASYAKNWIIPTMNSHSESQDDNDDDDDSDEDRVAPNDLKENFPVAKSIPTYVSLPLDYEIREKRIITIQPKIKYVIKYTYPVRYGDHLRITYVH